MLEFCQGFKNCGIRAFMSHTVLMLIITATEPMH